MHDQAHPIRPDQRDRCPECGHGWGAHATREAAMAAYGLDKLGVPCIHSRPGGSPWAICGCLRLVPESVTHPRR